MNRRSFVGYGASIVGGALGGGMLTGGLLREAAGKTKNTTACAIDKKTRAKICTVRALGQINASPMVHGKNVAAWAWVACVQTVLAYYGRKVSAVHVVKEAYGGDLPREPWKKPELLAREFVDDKNKKFKTGVEHMLVRASDAADCLAEGQPLIIGVFGHPVVLTKMNYTGDRLGGMTIVDAEVLDPVAGNRARVVSSPEWINVSFITRLYLKK